MNVLQRTALEFERLCTSLLVASGYSIEQGVDFASSDGGRFDVVAKRGPETCVIKIKWTRNNPVTLRQLRDWSATLAASIRLYSADLMSDSLNSSADSAPICLLIVSGTVDRAHRDWLQSEFLVRIWDRADLEELVHSHSELSEKFVEAFAKLDRLRAEMLAERTGEHGLVTGFAESAAPMAGYCRGAELATRLRSLAAGVDTAHDYERVCVEIIDYLFGESLLDARPQSRTEDGLNVLDLIYRINPAHLFWETLTRDFRSRVVIFECKNYSAPVGPHQVYTTERYLSVSALRSVCFLLSRFGPHEHAELAAFGAMRDSGKLIVFLDDRDLIEMLNVRDAQNSGTEASDNDPTIILDQKIYDFIARLPR
ncbi:restriction endonuclease [Bradyrhizobium sp. HKCCYLRH3099]|uniref:restriction endonuclease n=1 Tax=unclassified Bradyrhizobium TaxID=2631580 RepID=UPI003EC1338A